MSFVCAWLLLPVFFFIDTNSSRHDGNIISLKVLYYWPMAVFVKEPFFYPSKKVFDIGISGYALGFAFYAILFLLISIVLKNISSFDFQKRKLLFKFLLTAWFALPFLLSSFQNPSSLWWCLGFIFDRIYYFPFHSIGKPFFIPDSEAIFFVTWQGRFLGAIAYFSIFFAIKMIFNYRSKIHQKAKMK